MKAISVQQPFASLIVVGAKDIENRSRATNHRGRLLIHASQRIDSEAMRNLADLVAEDGETLDPADFPAGVIIGSVDLVDCVISHPSDWFDGPYGYVLANAQVFPDPIPVKGKLGIWEYEGMI